MSSWLSVELVPFGRLAFLPPTPFEAGVHGPGAIGVSLSYPYPSTVAGILAGLAYRGGLCRPEENSADGFRDQEMCIEKILGRNFILRPGLLSSGGRRYASIGGSVFPELECLRSRLRKHLSFAVKRQLPLGAAAASALREAAEECPRVVARRAPYTGIALNRTVKRPETGMLYTLESITYKPAASILVLAAEGSGDNRNLLEGPVKLGKRFGAGVIRVAEDGDNPLKPKDCETREWALLLLTPALLDSAPGTMGKPVPADGSIADRLALMLLGPHCSGRVECRTLYVPKRGRDGEHALEIMSPGWSLAARRPRPPMLLVPPGTVVYMRGLDASTMAHLASKGLGFYSSLGWGSVLPVPLETSRQ